MSEQGQAKPAHGATQAFFAGGNRKIHLEQLRHLSQWSRRVLVVTGPRGVGKTTLYRQLSASLEPRAKAARINGALVNSTREVLNAVVHGFGLAAPADADVQLLCDLIGGHAEAQERSERFCVTMVDDAELLEARALEQLINLAAAVPLRVVLFGEARLVGAVERATSSGNVGWHEITLAGLGPTEVRVYLEWWFGQQGYSGHLPFSDAQIKEVARLSEGLPGRIDQIANALLAKVQGGVEEHRGRRFPALHQALLAVLVVGIAFAYLVWQPTDDGVVTDLADVERLEVPPLPSREPAETDGPAAPMDQTPPPGPRGDDPATEASAPDPSVDAQAEPVRPTDTSENMETASREEQDQAPAPSASAPEQSQPAAPATAGSADKTLPAVISAQPDLKPEEPKDTSAAGAGEPADSGAGPRDAAWVMRQPASAYTLQLVTFSTAERATGYLARQSDPQSFARYRLQQSGKILHVVIYGSFESRSEAEQAAARLPDSAGNVTPWVRTFEQVQDAARTALQS
jgi:DamX protein